MSDTPQQQKRKIDLDNVKIVPLEKKHERGAFSCSVQTIQNYFRNNVRKQHDAYQVRAYVACEAGSDVPIGFYYLCLSAYEADEVDATAEKKFQRAEAIPAVYLGMVAVDANVDAKGLGKKLMGDAMRKTAKIADIAGTYALTLDALNQRLVGYYQDLGFELFQTAEEVTAESSEISMFITIRKIQVAITEADSHAAHRRQP